MWDYSGESHQHKREFSEKGEEEKDKERRGYVEWGAEIKEVGCFIYII